MSNGFYNDRLIDLIEEGIDATVRIGLSSDNSLIMHHLATAYYNTCASPQYLTQYGTPTTPTDLLQLSNGTASTQSEKIMEGVTAPTSEDSLVREAQGGARQYVSRHRMSLSAWSSPTLLPSSEVSVLLNLSPVPP